MKLTEVSVKRPVATFLLTLTVVVLGLFSIPKIPVSFWPEFVAPVVVVLVPYPGVGPEEIEEQIAKPLEEELSTLDDLDELETVCQNGMLRIMVRFDWGVDFDQAKLDVQDKTNKARSKFPREALEPKILQVQDFILPGIQLGFYSEKRSLDEVREFVDKKIKNQILRLPDVATATLFGGFDRNVEIRVDPQKLNFYELSLPQVAAAIARENRDVTAGKIKSDFNEQIVKLSGKFTDLDQIKKLIVANKFGRPVYLQDIAQVKFTRKERLVVSRLNGKEIVGLSVREKSGGNTVAMVKQVRRLMEELKPVFPADINVKVIEDQSIFINNAVRNVVRNALIGSVLAAIVIFLFLGSLRNTLIIALSIPLSVIATFLLIKWFGLSINIISLGGLALGVGMIVDSSVVVLENIFRHLQKNGRQNRLQTVVNATQEVGMAITSSTLTSIVVFLPLAFLVGLAAVLLGELALTVVFALTLAIIVALTVVPLLSYRLMRVDQKMSGVRKLSAWWQKAIEKLTQSYRKGIAFSLRHRVFTLLLAGIILAASLAVIFPRLDVVLLPVINQGQFEVQMELPVGTKLEKTIEVTTKIEKKILQMPEVEKTFTVIGQAVRIGETKSNSAKITVDVKSGFLEQIDRVMNEIRSYCQTIPALKTKVKQIDATAGMQTQPINVRINGDNLQTLKTLGDSALTRIKRIPGVVNITSSLQEGVPEYRLTIDRLKATELGISFTEAANALRSAVLGNPISRFSAYGQEYDIVLKLQESALQDINTVLQLPLVTRDGRVIPLGRLVKVETDRGPGEIKHFDQQRVVQILADIQGRSRREVNAEVHKILAELPLPAGYFITYGGMSRGIKDSFISLGNALLIAIFLVYVVMGSQFNSFIHPFTIALSIPLAIVGVLAGLWVFNASISTNAFLGSIMLVGIVVNNGILLLDYIGQLRARGLTKNEAIIEGGATRLRPILITSLTTIFGMLPIALGLGEGGEALKPLGAVVVGGLSTSTFLTLFIIPVVYSLLDRFKKKQELN
ncbi:acriflavin resistance protein [Caldithrix abyssi DSM 13497]|uniref:Acriflavin resistance protein n=1 Tax=Caldithrix abyssi DSM 13497 TaxID=880073 RepID=H1XYY1_CALAY|nr:efflux RND transporter permease subunit [Caldithrix abyssi]APF18004.1 hydrophobic/amphiphilic exporter-1, HAE1 family [Caldithrix abyssi DSM 13497]EHO42052.1 acriflavin resistance protein [Caldithrix abyssi DSM 13497]